MTQFNIAEVGTAQHQQVLTAIRDVYADDARVRQILIFGSLSRGNWDAYSDLDLDIIVADHVAINIQAELEHLCAGLHKLLGVDALIIANTDEGDVVLSNLVEFSVRYHPLDDTKPAILDSMLTVAGDIPHEAIHAAANPAHASKPVPLEKIVNALIRCALGLHNAIMRRRVWMATHMLYSIRGLLMRLLAESSGEIRPIHYFDAHATPEQQTLLTSLCAAPDLAATAIAFRHVIDVLEHHLGTFSNGTYKLDAVQQNMIASLKQKPLYADGLTS